MVSVDVKPNVSFPGVTDKIGKERRTNHLSRYLPLLLLGVCVCVCVCVYARARVCVCGAATVITPISLLLLRVICLCTSIPKNAAHVVRGHSI